MRFWALLFVGCATIRQPLCVSKCGLKGYDAPICEGLQEVEDRTLRAFAYVPDVRMHDACRAYGDLGGVEVLQVTFPRPTQTGQAYCWKGRIEVNSLPAMDGSLAHELAHIAQHCRPLPPYEADLDHSNWAPIYEALKAEGLKE